MDSSGRLQNNPVMTFPEIEQTRITDRVLWNPAPEDHQQATASR